jgi:VIT1/CCC1 family predicted Fe2+/Mn2+ transporter
MKLCFCRFLLAAAIVVIAVFFLDQSWAKLVLIIAGALLAIMSLFYNKCCLAGKAKPAEKPAE